MQNEKFKVQSAPETRKRWSWRATVRSLHRDAGYLAVGFTIIYALSGLAVNHVKDWDPNFTSAKTIHQIALPLPKEEAAATQQVLDALHLKGPVREAHLFGPEQLDIRLDNATLHVDPTTGRVIMEGQQPRFFLRFANWLHLNRGKTAWTIIADTYAAGLLFLALSGMFMLPGKNGMRGRGGLFVAIGVAVPVLYVVLSGGPR
jgi:hypothetical protein